ncbi:carbonic anhydrase [Streptomyces sp. NBC_00841]|uniref:carbonic anhydrase n=1 Tax=unclassified Streptomyces TaxID=2593676 RepID=UPI002255D100|nr:MULTISPECIES: carbonic anhydrase [unclassified Streptomyces]MCX4537397.1 carbonic anhydrase [Streptomyces sp. NBC_01669]WRZ97378.1 carbonic anhydrase [Streptomyces sp. NBC_00841]
MQTLIEHARTFHAKITDKQQEFAQLAHGQQPQVLFISCSDSRVIPSLFTGARPGDLFEVRSAANIVPSYRPQAACAVAGSIEFAVQALQVPDIVVCGHSHCGAVQSLLREQSVHTMPPVRRWLTWAGYRTWTDEPWPTRGLGEDATAATQQHVLTQLDHLRTYPFVARRLDLGRLRLHAWYYTVETGEVLACAPGSRVFKSL